MALDGTYKRWKQSNSSEDFKKLLDETKNIQSSALKSYGGLGDPFSEGKARILAAEALRSYDPSKGAAINTHLMSQLRRLHRYSDRNSLINIPEDVRYGKNRIYEAERELASELDRDPTDSELADRTGFSLRKLRKYKSYATAPKLESSFVDEEGREYMPGVDAGDDAAIDYVYFDLPATDRKIMEWRTGYNGAKQLSNNEIAKKLRISPGAVSQRMNSIISKWQHMKGLV